MQVLKSHIPYSDSDSDVEAGDAMTFSYPNAVCSLPKNTEPSVWTCAMSVYYFKTVLYHIFAWNISKHIVATHLIHIRQWHMNLKYQCMCNVYLVSENPSIKFIVWWKVWFQYLNIVLSWFYPGCVLWLIKNITKKTALLEWDWMRVSEHL